MKLRDDKYPTGAIIDKGEEIYNRLIRPSLEKKNLGRVIAIDVDSEDFEIGDEGGAVTDQLLRRRPDAWVALMRIGGGGVYRIGFLPPETNS